MEHTKFSCAKNFFLFLACVISLLLALPFLKDYVGNPSSVTGFAGATLLLPKLLVKFLPLIAALMVEYVLSAQNQRYPRSIFSWNRSRVIDLYCYALTHLHKVIGLLTVMFTLSIPFLLERFIAEHIPAEFSLFSLIEKNSHVAIAALFFFVIASFSSYWEHRLWHTRIMWPIHRFHHSATEYNVLTETRKHFTEVLLTPVFYTLPLMLLGAPAQFVAAYLSLVLFQGFMNHTDQDISYGWIGRHLWIDPIYHKLHHSSAPEHMNKNFGGTLPIWDRLFGTYMHDHSPIAVGVSGADHYERLPYWRIYIKDFCDFMMNIHGALKDVMERWSFAAKAGN